MYKDLRKKRVEIFEETKRLCQTDKRLAESIVIDSRQNQKVISGILEVIKGSKAHRDMVVSLKERFHLSDYQVKELLQFRFDMR